MTIKKVKTKDRLVVPKKKKTRAQLKKMAWTEFSRFIRLRDTDEKGFGFCVTCKEPQKLHWKKLQAGHFAQSRCNSILFDEQGTNAQCARCNIWLHGALDNYADFMVKKYGVGIIEEMKIRKWSKKDYSPSDLEEIYEKYKRLADIYERNKK
jgi:hypothetical protein